MSTRAHTQGESEDQYEASSRVFSNPNRCRALSFLFYKLNKCQTIRWELVGIERSVLDPAAPTSVESNDSTPFDGVTVIPNSVLATSKQRLDVERSARTSVAEKVTALGAGLFSRAAVLASFAGGAEPLTAADRQATLDAVDQELIAGPRFCPGGTSSGGRPRRAPDRGAGGNSEAPRRLRSTANVGLRKPREVVGRDCRQSPLHRRTPSCLTQSPACLPHMRHPRQETPAGPERRGDHRSAGRRCCGTPPAARGG